jgi:hypothetical protein
LEYSCNRLERDFHSLVYERQEDLGRGLPVSSTEMIRFKIYHFTGAKAKCPKMASHLQQRIKGAIGSGHTVIIDFEDVHELTSDFATGLLPEIDEMKLRIVGLPPDQKERLNLP